MYRSQVWKWTQSKFRFVRSIWVWMERDVGGEGSVLECLLSMSEKPRLEP